MNKFRTHTCAELSENDIDKNIILSGWVHRKRDTVICYL
jgi:Aspartyl-tRNA synthetase